MSNQDFCNTQIVVLPIGESLGAHKTKISDENRIICSLTKIQTHLSSGIFERVSGLGKVLHIALQFFIFLRI